MGIHFTAAMENLKPTGLKSNECYYEKKGYVDNPSNQYFSAHAQPLSKATCHMAEVSPCLPFTSVNSLGSHFSLGSG